MESPSLDPADETRRLLSRGLAGELRRLRAVQTELFLGEARTFAVTRRATEALRELGGDFAEVASVSWLGDDGRLLLTEDELRLLFRLRWGKITGTLDDEELAPSLAELRAYHALLLALPPGGLVGDPASLGRARAGTVLEYGSLDPEYPVDLALGLLELDAGEPDRAESSFLREMNSTRRGARRLRLAHHLREARRLSLEEF